MKLLTNGNIYTSEGFVSSLIIEDKTIAFTGSGKEALSSLVNQEYEEIDLMGQTVIPGMIDSHAHGGLFGVSSQEGLYIESHESAEDCIQAVRDYVKGHPELTFIKGHGWPSPLFGEEGPSKESLDEIAGDIPVAIQSIEGHAYWVNSKLLEMAGITKETEDPIGGRIFRKEDGTPSGCLADEAQGLITHLIPDYSIEAYMRSIEACQKEMASYGITAAGELMIDYGSNLQKAYERLSEEGRLLIKAVLHYTISPADYEERLKALEDHTFSFRDKLSNGAFVKFFADGVVENETAALSEDYSDRPGWSGELLWSDEVLKKAFVKADQMGYGIHIHCIGERALKQAIDAFEHMQKVNGPRDGRKQVIAHIQLADPEDIKRMGSLGIMAAANPYWFFKDPVYTPENEIPCLGAERVERQYPMKSLFDAGITVSGASDSICEIPYPVLAIRYGMLRIYHECPGTDTSSLLGPEERCTFEEMFDCMTKNGAVTLDMEHVTGEIREGMLADLAVLDRNIFETPPDDFPSIQVTMTISEGKIIFEK